MPTYSLINIPTSPNLYVQWYEGKHSRRCSTRTSSREEAEAFLAAFRLAQADEPVDELTVPQALDWYWDSYAYDLMRPDNAALAIKNLKTFFGSTPAADCVVAKQQAYVDHKRALRYGNESIRRDLSVLSAALRRAEKHNKLSRAPPMLTLTPAPRRERWMTRDEVAKLFRRLRRPRSRHVLLFARLALYTGARTQAILDLTWDRVDLKAGMIDFNVPGRRLTKKRRTMSPIGGLGRALAHQYKRRRSNHVIEWGGQRIGRVAKAFIAGAEDVGMDDVSPHVLRHSFATWAARKGVPIYHIGKALGQTVASTTERYAKHQPEDIAAVMKAVRRK